MKIGVRKPSQFTCRLLKVVRLGGFLSFFAPALLILNVQAQEAPPVQQFAHRVFLNPAFTGLLSDYSLTAGHRSQWTGAQNGFSTQWLSGEYRFKESKTAVGLTVLSDREPAGGFARLQAGAVYAYHTKLRENLDFSAGLQAAFASQKPSFSGLVFEDQLGSDGSVQQPTAETLDRERSMYATVATGFLLFTDQFWLGASAQHLNNPTTGRGAEATLPPVFQVQTGYRFYVKNYYARNSLKELSFTPTLSYLQQRSFKRLDGNLYTIITPITLGIGYSYLPGGSQLPVSSAVSGLLGLAYKGFKVGYGYRTMLSGQRNALGPTHEISVGFAMADYEKIFKRLGSDKNYNRIACPEF
ncbi:PorP/SprF family type IX secretion system membrane protein [Nibribacter koreensis]|uniref:PorP/SprF family type IX secretion system membrane protein n=1 Tax=Nibribacter koreensis TaxID=1084519 RepID=UPI0031E6ABD4